ncbi:hypothetical protein P4O66_005582 [Electrophorus voltai]|uniref:Uncharacterized protein n=1 Tax=Electrophorus voltai TaxID=2609070 RepID=A0AAD8ZLN0_9TELE|nr:hypothetical protein P4O66_005582 [Electrophorus voltai]
MGTGRSRPSRSGSESRAMASPPPRAALAAVKSVVSRPKSRGEAVSGCGYPATAGPLLPLASLLYLLSDSASDVFVKHSPPLLQACPSEAEQDTATPRARAWRRGVQQGGERIGTKSQHSSAAVLPTKKDRQTARKREETDNRESERESNSECMLPQSGWSVSENRAYVAGHELLSMCCRDTRAPESFRLQLLQRPLGPPRETLDLEHNSFQQTLILQHGLFCAKKEPGDGIHSGIACIIDRNNAPSAARTATLREENRNSLGPGVLVQPPGPLPIGREEIDVPLGDKGPAPLQVGGDSVQKGRVFRVLLLGSESMFWAECRRSRSGAFSARASVGRVELVKARMGERCVEGRVGPCEEDREMWMPLP